MSENLDLDKDHKETADVFVVYCQADIALARDICKVLKENGLKCLADCKCNAFQPGQLIVDNIVNNIQHSKRTLLILTQNARKSSWVLLETILAMERSKSLNCMILRILTVDISSKDMDSLNRGLLADVPHITTDNSQSDWKLKLYQDIKRDIPLKDILPVGSLAHGLVFSHFVGFLSYVLPNIREAIEKSQIYVCKPLLVSKKYHLLLPRTFKMLNNLEGENTETGTKITKLQEPVEILPIRHHVGKERPVKLTIYKICRGDKEYYFYADCPNVLNAIFTMSNEELAPVDVQFQMARFYHTMNDVLNHDKNLKCRDTLTFLLYHESDKWKSQNICDELFATIEEELSVEPKEKSVEFSHTSVSANTDSVHVYSSLTTSMNDEKEYDAVISCFEEDDIGCRLKQELSDYLELENKSLAPDHAGTTAFSVPKAKWYIFIITKVALQKPNVHMRCFKNILTANINHNALNVLPVIVNLQPHELPNIIKWVTLVKADEPRYREKVLQTINGGVAMMEHRLPAGDVATGLAWAYVINYLQIILRDLKTKIERFLTDKHISCGCILKMFILVPKSCTVRDHVHEEANAGIKAVEPVGDLDVSENTGGRFLLNMYKYTGAVTCKSICFISEYCTPVHCMHEMANKYQFAGLTNEDLDKQCQAFVKLLPEILSRQPVIDKYGDLSNLVEVVYYDDEKEKLLPALEKHILSVQPLVFSVDHQDHGDGASK